MVSNVAVVVALTVHSKSFRGKKRRREHDDEMATNPIPILFDVITHHDDDQVLVDLKKFFDDPAD